MRLPDCPTAPSLFYPSMQYVREDYQLRNETTQSK